MEDPFLNYFALGLLFFVVITLVYGIIAIHDIPAKIADARHHPHADAIYAAGWVSLFLLHVLWPFLWIWAMMYRPDRGWGFAQKPGEPASPQEAETELEGLRHRMTELEAKLETKDRAAPLSKGQQRPAIDSPGLSVPAVEEGAPRQSLQVQRVEVHSDS
jgi:type VI protein secretion system component VasK